MYTLYTHEPTHTHTHVCTKLKHVYCTRYIVVHFSFRFNMDAYFYLCIKIVNIKIKNKIMAVRKLVLHAVYETANSVYAKNFKKTP